MSGFIGGALLLIGAIAAGVGTFLWSRARKQSGWEAVPGTVCVSEVDFDWEFYRQRIEYTCSYRGRTFRGQKWKSLALLVNWPGPADGRL